MTMKNWVLYKTNDTLVINIVEVCVKRYGDGHLDEVVVDLTVGVDKSCGSC